MGQNQRKSISKKVSSNLSRRKYYSRGDSSKEASISLPLRAISSGIIVFSVAFLASCLTASIVTPVQNSDAAQIVQASIDDSGYYANVTSSDVVNLDLIATQDGAYAIAHDTVTTTTNSATGYKLYISADSNVANSNRLNLSGDKTSDYYLSPSTGTTASPTTLADNTWGYSLTTLTGNNNEVTSASNFIGLPLLSSENLLHTYGYAATSGNSVDVYYGIKANTALPTGIYTATVVYTVVAEGSPATEGKVALSSYESTSKSGGNTITISTGLYTSSLDLGTVSVLIGDQTCSNLTQVSTQTGEVKLSCTVPAQTNLGDYDVTVSIPKFEKTYTLEDGFHYYIPWENMTYMQDMTSYACNKVATPSAFTNGDTSPRYVYGPVSGSTTTMTDSTIDPVNDWSTYGPYAYISNINTDVPEKYLIDNRDNNSYRIRKLADGNCWMTENLRLVFADDSGQIGAVNAAGTNISGNGKYISEDNSNVGKNAVGGSASSRWSTSQFNAGGTVDGSAARTEIVGVTTGDFKATKWGATASATEKHTSSTDSGSADETTMSAYSEAFARSIYDPTEKNDCTGGHTISQGNMHDDCFILDNTAQKAGTFYNYTAATAGTARNIMGEITDSICPSGWRLPKNTGEKSFTKLLMETYSDNAVSNIDVRSYSMNAELYQTIGGMYILAISSQIQMAPISMAYAGVYRAHISSGIPEYRNGTGYWWEWYAGSMETAASFDMMYGRIITQGGAPKGTGQSIRCVSQ